MSDTTTPAGAIDEKQQKNSTSVPFRLLSDCLMFNVDVERGSSIESFLIDLEKLGVLELAAKHGITVSHLCTRRTALSSSDLVPNVTDEVVSGLNPRC